MGKRKNKHDESHIRRKIQRLERRLRHRSSSSSSPSESYDDSKRGQSPYHDEDQITELNDLDENILRSVVEPVQLDDDVDQHLPTATSNNPTTSIISEEILEILGEAKKLEMPLGEKIPEEISERWGKIILDGLATEQKTDLKTKMLVPENFTLIRAPKLNPEVASVLSESSKNRDKRLELSQNQLGLGIAGLVNLTKYLINSDSIDKLLVLKKISEVSQLLLDLHHEESINRRKLITPLLDKKFWNIIKGVRRDDFLFGEKLGENIKTSKEIEKSSQQIKKPTPTFSNPPNQRRVQPGNSRAPPRQHVTTPSRQRDARPAPARRTTQPAPQRARRSYRSYDKKNRH